MINNEQQQQIGSNHHLNNENKINSPWAKLRRTYITKETSPTRSIKPSWQIARDITIDILSRQPTKLSTQQGTIPSLTRQRSITKKNSLYGFSTDSKSSQLHRTPRMPTEDEANKVKIAYKLICSFCNGPCIGDYVRCRVCIRTYHSQCLFERGHVSDQIRLPRLAKQNWTCPDCEDLTRLLNQDEIHLLIHAFERIDRNKDGYIILDEFLSFKTNKTTANDEDFELFIQYNYDVGKKFFNLMDSSQKGVVAWSDFVHFYSCKMIAAKDKIELATKLTEKELVMAKNIFFKDPRKTFDNNHNIIVTREYFNQVQNDLIQSLKDKFSTDFIDAILTYDPQNDEKSEIYSVMNWTEFLREISLLLLLNRFNKKEFNHPRQATIPIQLTKQSINSHINISLNENNLSNKLIFPRLNTPITTFVLPNISCDNSFRKHAKLLEKLNQQDELKRKYIDSNLNYTLLENSNENNNNIHLPKLKSNARDDRKTITDPWTSVKEMQQLRNQPILIKTNRI